MAYYCPLEGYQIIEPTKDKEKKKQYWETAIGLQQVDRLMPSQYLLDLAREHIEGRLENGQVKEALRRYYGSRNGEEDRTRECDLVSQRIVELLEQGSFSFSPMMLKTVHGYLFEGILSPEASGKFRRMNIRKGEEILQGESVNYANYFSIEELLEYDFRQEKGKHYRNPPTEEEIKGLAEFTSSIWQVHPFMEGNTRTTAVFIELYLRSMGFAITNDPFQQYSEYFRGALVRSNYANVQWGVWPDFQYLIKFYEALLKGAEVEMELSQLQVQSQGK